MRYTAYASELHFHVVIVMSCSTNVICSCINMSEEPALEQVDFLGKTNALAVKNSCVLYF
jgi:hypothetical protein